MRCLGSIPVRDDVQVIVVDDCSPDAEQYLDKYPALHRPNLEFYSTPRGGSAGRARNVGLQHALGQWCLFADADDLYVEGFLDILDQELTEELDILYFKIAGDGERAQTHRSIFGLYQKYHDETEIRYHIWAPWNKVIARRLITSHRLQFEEVRIGNDALFCLQASRVAQCYKIISNPLYTLTDNEGSITFRENSFEREFDYIKVRTRITRFMEELGLQYKYGYHLFSLSRLIRFLKQYGVSPTLHYLAYISQHYGLIKALRYNRTRKAYQALHPELIYCD